MKHTKIILVFLLATILALSCRTKDLIPVGKINMDYSIIDGDTIETRTEKDYQKILKKAPLSGANIIVGDTVLTYQEIKLHTSPVKIPDLSKLKNNDDPELKGKPLRYIAVGGSVTAGFRDGGYFNEGILTSYPNLIARQMRLDKFEQPLFESTDYNGTGRIVATKENMNGGPVQKFKMALNNNGIESVDDKKVIFKLNKKSNLNNFAIPFLQTPAYGYAGSYSTFSEEKQNLVYTSLYKRVINDDDGYKNKILKEKFDFIIIELGQTESLLRDLLGIGIGSSVSNESKVFEKKPYDETKFGFDYDVSASLFFLRRLEEKGISKGVLLNVPNYLKFPYFNIVTPEMISMGVGNGVYINLEGSVGPSLYEPLRDIMLPTSTIDSLLSPKVHVALKKGVFKNPPLPYRGNVVYNGRANNFITDYNEEIHLLSKRFNYPIADISDLYERILDGSYLSSDGVKVNVKDFFSSDGIHPSALGQACIANEVIKTINLFYKTSIELISIKEYIRK